MRSLCSWLPTAAPGSSVTLEGWVHRRRELARVTFLIVRDRSGLAQVVLPAGTSVPPEETTGRVVGTATARPQAPGGVEVTDALVTGVAGRLPWGELARRVDGLEGSVEMRWAVVPGNAFGTHPVTRVDTVHGPVLRAADINLALVGFEHGRTDPTEPGDGDAEGPLEFRGTFTTTPGSRTTRRATWRPSC